MSSKGVPDWTDAPMQDLPTAAIPKPWRPYVFDENERVADPKAFFLSIVLVGILFLMVASASASASAAVASSTVVAESTHPLESTIPLIVDTIGKAVAAASVILAGSWAWFRFVRFRTLKKRVEFAFDWNTDKTSDGYLTGILTVKLSNKGNTPIILRKNDKFRCPLSYALVRPNAAARSQLQYLNARPKDLQALPFLFKAHRLVEPGETIDDVAILSMTVGDAVAIQFQAEVFSVRAAGGKERLMSSVAAFPLKGKSGGGPLVSEDEQDEYDDVREARAWLKGLIGEGVIVLDRGYAQDKAPEIEKLLEQARLFEASLHDESKREEVDAANACADKLHEAIRPFM